MKEKKKKNNISYIPWGLRLVFEGPVRSGFYPPKRGNRQPQPVQIVAQKGWTATGPRLSEDRGQPQLGCLLQPVVEPFFRTYFFIIYTKNIE